MSAAVARVLRWSAWSAGREHREDWERWARAPEPLAGGGHPDAAFLPAMLRRRCTPLTRTVLTAAFDCLAPDERDAVRSVFASRHGGLNESIELLENVARGERISPAKFSHGVHNAQAALFALATGNRFASSSLAAGPDSFACGWIEALAHLEREPARRVLCVMADVVVSPVFADLVSEPSGSYAVALLLGRGGERSDPAPEIAFEVRRGAPVAPRAWPDALEFLRWLLGEEAALELGRFRWSRQVW